MKAKPWTMNEENEGMWTALKTNQPNNGETFLYLYAPTYQELKEEVEKAGITDAVFHKLGFGRGEIIPDWSRMHPNNMTSCTCICGEHHYIKQPDARDWRKAQGLLTKE